MVNIPLVQDKLALRIVGSDAYTSGWIDRIDLGPTNFPYETAGTNGSVTAIPFDPGAASGNRGNVLGITPVSQDKGSNWQTIEGVRATLLWSPTDSLSIAPMVMYQKLAQGGESLVDLPPGDNVLAHYQPYNVAEPYSDTVKIFSLPIKYTIDNIQLVSETAYIQRNTNQIQDSSEIGVDVFPVAATYAEVGPVWSYEGDNTSQFTQEFRASSTGDGAFQWLGGLYYQNYKSTTSLSTNPANAFVDAAFTAANPTAAPVPSGVDLFNWNLITKLTQYAAFGEASYKLGDFKLTGGVRYFSYNVPETNIYAGAYQAPDNYTAATALVEHLPASASGVTPRVNLSYIPNPDLTLYAQASEGFRPGFGNAQPPESEDCPGGVLPAAAPDTVWNYEGGEKARLMDGHLILNGDVYYEYWKGIQESIDLVCGHGNEFSYSGNAGVARIYGSELEVALPITPEITIGTSVGYADARFVSVSSVSGFFAGEQLPLVSKLTDTTSLLYTHHLDDDYNFVFRATDIYKSSQTFVYIQAPQSNFLNVRLGLVSQHKVSAWLFADNVTDEHTFLGISNAIYSELTDAYRGVSPQPRTIGIELDYAFGGR
jgi:outer membrane receptor protein involved in Fe transport